MRQQSRLFRMLKMGKIYLMKIVVDGIGVDSLVLYQGHLVGG